MLCKSFGVSTEVVERRVKREELWPPKAEQIRNDQMAEQSSSFSHPLFYTANFKA
jgi:hypothetical protein